MKTITFYKNEKGESQVANYLRVLALKNDKDSRINLEKINDYLKALSLSGVKIGMPYCKHIVGKIWELRPLKNRIFFFEYENKYIMLHIFKKETQKTPKQEIYKAIKERNDYTRENEHE